MSDKRTEVRRISKSELRLLDVIRNYDMERLVDALDEGVESVSIDNSEILRAIRFALKPNVFHSLPVLKEEGIISGEGLKLVEEAIADYRNIMIVGGLDSGRTSCLQSLLQQASLVHSTVTTVLESAPELSYRFSSSSADNIRCYNTSLLSATDMFNVLSMTQNYIAMGDVKSGRDSILMDFVLSLRLPFLGVIETPEKENLPSFLSSIVKRHGSYAETLVSDFVEGSLIIECVSEPTFQYKVYQWSDI